VLEEDWVFEVLGLSQGSVFIAESCASEIVVTLLRVRAFWRSWIFSRATVQVTSLSRLPNHCFTTKGCDNSTVTTNSNSWPGELDSFRELPGRASGAMARFGFAWVTAGRSISTLAKMGSENTSLGAQRPSFGTGPLN